MSESCVAGPPRETGPGAARQLAARQTQCPSALCPVRRKGRLRSAVAGGLGVRNAPLLVFRKSGMSSEEARLESVLEGLAIEDLPSQRGF